MSNDYKSPLPPRRVSVPELGEEKPLVTEEISTSNPTSNLNPPQSPLNQNPPPLPPLTGRGNTFVDKLKKFLPVIGVVVLLVLIVGGVMMARKGKITTKQEVTLNYWGLWEDPSNIEAVLTDFEAKNPGIKVNYKKNTKDDYRSRLQGRLAKTGGEDVPDIFRIHATWIPMLQDSMAAVPAKTTTAIGLDSDFFGVYKEDLKINGAYYGIPLMYDGLSLYYNKNILEAAGKVPPKTWWGLRDLAKKLTVKDAAGKIKVAGVAMGLTDNVDHWSDIVGLMMKQNGVDPYSRTADNQKKLQDILTFYSLFKTTDGVWDESLPPSTLDFADGKLAFYFGPSWRVFDIENLKSADLRYGIVAVPQLPTLEGISPEKIESGEMEANLTNIHWASYWIEAVNNKSKNQAEAWKLLEFLSSSDSLSKMYTASTTTRAFGEIYPRKSMQGLVAGDKMVTPFVGSADNASSWYLASKTYDSGVNDEMITYFGNAINGLVSGKSGEMVMTDLLNGMTQVTGKYRLTKK